MKRLLLLAMLATILGSGSGCCIIDRVFHCPCGRWRGGGCCGPCDTCAPCPGCSDCNCPYGDGAISPDGPVYSGAPFYNQGPSFSAANSGCCCSHCAGGAGPGYATPQGPPGPPVGQVAYPYYTTRGPRDFLARRPTDIGP